MGSKTAGRATAPEPLEWAGRHAIGCQGPQNILPSIEAVGGLRTFKKRDIISRGPPDRETRGPRGPFLFFLLLRWKFSPLAAWETNSPRRERVGGAAGGKTRSGRGSLIVRSPQDVAPRAPRRPFGSARCVCFVRLGGSSFVLSSFLVACSRRLFSHAHSLCVASYSATACCACCR